jgi:hypothetical protein
MAGKKIFLEQVDIPGIETYEVWVMVAISRKNQPIFAI